MNFAQVSILQFVFVSSGNSGTPKNLQKGRGQNFRNAQQVEALVARGRQKYAGSFMFPSRPRANVNGACGFRQNSKSERKAPSRRVMPRCSTPVLRLSATGEGGAEYENLSDNLAKIASCPAE
jgi:hypothetical protein